MKTLTISFDERAFSLIAIKKAAYRYVYAFTTDISIVDGQISCVLTFDSPTNEDDKARLCADFKKEVLDQDLRETLQVQTEAVRNVILSHAFSRTGLSADAPLPSN